MRIRYIKSNYVLNTKGFILNNYYLAILNDYCKKENSISIIEAIKIQTPYAIATGVILLCLTILWYVIGLPTGINGATIL